MTSWTSANDERFAYERTRAINAEAIRVVNARVQEARIETQQEAVLKMLRAGKLTIDEIADYTDSSIGEVKKLQSELRMMN